MHFSHSAKEKNSQSSTPIQFVYAIHDAIFSNQYVSADAQIANQESLAHSFSRAKFFDIIIPVVPFVSASNSYQIALETLEDVLDANDPQMINLLELVADAVPDKRTWINIRNEFIVYKEQLLNPKRTNLGLSPVKMLAILIYKNCYLDDAIKLQNGRSRLDHIYKEIREIIQEDISALDYKNKNLKYKINEISNGRAAEEYASELRTDLIYLLADLNNQQADRCQSINKIIMDNFRDYTEGANETELLNASAALIRKGKNIDEATRQDLAEHDDGLDNTRSLLDAEHDDGLDNTRSPLDAEHERQSAIAMFADALEYAVTHGQTENDIVRNMKQIFQKLGDEYLKFINPNSKCINLPNTIENRQIIKTLRNWKPELISQTEEINEGDSIKIKRDQKLWNGFFKQGE